MVSKIKRRDGILRKERRKERKRRKETKGEGRKDVKVTERVKKGKRKWN